MTEDSGGYKMGIKLLLDSSDHGFCMSFLRNKKFNDFDTVKLVKF